MDEDSKHSETVTEEDINASLKLKEEINDDLGNDSISYVGSVGTLSNLSTGSALSLNALRQKRIKLIESIQSVLDSSNLENGECSTPNTSIAFDDCLLTSTPYKEQSLPPAATFLKDWRCFSKIEEIADEDDDSAEQPIRYEEAFESLKEILGQSGDVLGAYESALDVYQKEEGEKLEKMMNFFEVHEDTTPTNILTVIDLVSTGSDGNDTTVITIPDSPANETVIERDPVANDGGQKQLDPKDPENIIIEAEGDATLVNEEDEDRLLASDDEEQEQKEGPATAAVEGKKGWTEFVSNDPAENADNNDPQWERLRNLGTDYERYLAVRQRWRNIDIPNPKKDLTCRCQRTVETSVPVPLNESRKRPHSPEPNYDNKRSKMEPCTMLFDRGIAKVLADLEIQKQKLDRDQKTTMDSLAVNQRLEQMNFHYARGGRVTDQDRRALRDKQYKETYDLMRSFGMRRDHLVQSSRQKMQALRRAADEVKEFHEFYPATDEHGEKSDKNSLTFLTGSEVEEILEVETMFSRFAEFYSGSRCEQQCQ